MTAATLQHTPDLLAVVAFAAVIWLFAWPQIKRERAKRPGGIPTASDQTFSKGQSMTSVQAPQSSREAPCPWCDGEGGWLMEPRSCNQCAGTGVEHG